MTRMCVSLVVLSFLAGGVVEGQDAKGPKKTKGKFTISKETTYVTGPLDKDGYIDYAAALNERLRQGVTPANNANVLLWKAFGPHPERATMPPEFFKWLGIEQPPQKGKYFVDFREHIKKHVEVDPSRKQGDVLNDFDAASERPWQTKKYPVVAGWLTANEQPLAVVLQATKRSHYFSPLVSKETDKGPSGLIASLLPAVQKCRELAYFLQIQVMLHLGEGRYDDAWQDLLTCHRLGRHLARGGTLIETLVGIAIDNIASHADIVFLDRAKLDAKRIKQCLRDLQALPPLPSVADKIDLGERFMFLDSVMMIDRHGTKYVDDIFMGGRLAGALGGGAGPKIPELLAQRILTDIDWDPALRNANYWYDRLVAAMRVKERGMREKKLDEIEDDLKTLKSSLGDAETLIQRLASDKQTAQTRGKMVGDGLISLLAPAVRKVQTAADRTEQVQRNLHVAFALAAYQRDHGRYPLKLDALAPKYLAQVPQDLFSGKALIYRPSEKGYLVYSVGPNGQDDQGRWYDDVPPGDDPRVRMPPPQ